MKIGFIIIFYKTPRVERTRIVSEVHDLNVPEYDVIEIDNTVNNKGFAGGVNNGIQQAIKKKCDIFIIINPDTILKNLPTGKSFINLLIEDEKHFDIWGYSLIQDNQVYYGGELDRWRMSGGLIKKKPDQRFSECDFVSGSFLCIKKKVIDTIGLLEEKYFMYYEDVEYCLRAKRAGFRVGIDSNVIYKHLEISKTNPEKAMYLIRNRILFLLEYGNLKQKLFELFRLPLTMYEERNVIIHHIRKDKFFINFLSLNVASIANKVIFFILFIFLFRHLGVSQYGVYTLVWAHTALLSPLLDLGTTSYGIIYSPTEPIQKIKTLISLRVILSLIVFILTVVLGFVFQYDPRTLLFIFLTSVIIFSNALSGSLLIISSILNKAYVASLASFIFNIILVAIQISILVYTQSLSLIFWSIFILYGLYTCANVILINRYVPGISYFHIDLSKWRTIITKSYVFVLIGLFAGLYYKVDVFLLNILKGQAAVGVYSAGYKFLDALMFIPASYNMTSTPIFARLHKENTSLFVQRIKRDLVLVGVLGFSASAAVYFIAPFILPIILRREITDSIPVIKIVVFALPFMLLSSVFFNTLYILNKPKLVIWLFAFQCIFNGVLNYLLIPVYSYTASAYITVFSECINFIILTVAVINYLKRNSYENRR